MSGVIGVINTTAEVALVASSARIVLRLHAAGNHPVKIKEWGVFFDGVQSSAEPVYTILARCSSDGTMTGVTCKERTNSGITLQTSGYVALAAGATSEAAIANILAMREVHPQAGYQEKFAAGDEIVVGSSGYICIQVTSATTMDALAEFVFEE